VLDASITRCSIVAEESSLPKSEQKLTDLLNGINNSHSTVSEYSDSGFAPLSRAHRLFVPIPAQVNFVAELLPTVPFTHPDSAKLKALSSLASSLYLHQEIREKGGAYGSGATTSEGIWSFYSFRDPNTTRTLDVFAGILKWLKQGSFQEKDIEEAKLRLFSSIDYPVAPSKQGMLEFTNGITWEMRQRHREVILAATRKDLIEVAEKYLTPSEASLPSITIFGNMAHNPFTAEETRHLAILESELPVENENVPQEGRA
jgi:Zn-dependent M16 (insulinase) family peptidase